MVVGLAVGAGVAREEPDGGESPYRDYDQGYAERGEVGSLRAARRGRGACLVAASRSYELASAWDWEVAWRTDLASAASSSRTCPCRAFTTAATGGYPRRKVPFMGGDSSLVHHVAGEGRRRVLDSVVCDLDEG